MPRRCPTGHRPSQRALWALPAWRTACKRGPARLRGQPKLWRRLRAHYSIAAAMRHLNDGWPMPASGTRTLLARLWSWLRCLLRSRITLVQQSSATLRRLSHLFIVGPSEAVGEPAWLSERAQTMTSTEPSKRKDHPRPARSTRRLARVPARPSSPRPWARGPYCLT